MRAKQLRQGVVIGILLIVCFGLLSLIGGLVNKAQIAIGEAQSAQTDYQALEARKQTLEANIAALGTTRGKDAAIRTAFGVARPGEEVIVVVPLTSTTSTTSEPWWHWLVSWF